MVLVPSAGAVMADFGAEVIKVESPGVGDVSRHMHRLPGMPVSEFAYVFQQDNRNKKSVVLDLKQDAAREILRKLVATADVFTSNFRLAALEKLGLTYEQLQPINPRLIYAYASGYGDKGADAAKPGYDANSYWARSGIEDRVVPLQGWLGAPFPYGAGDHPSAMTLLAGILLALYAREKSGLGTKVSTSLLACGAWANATELQGVLCGARVPEKPTRENYYNYAYISYRSGDGKLFKLSIVDQKKHWPLICQAVGRPDLIEDARFNPIEVRLQHMKELIAIFDEAFAKQNLDYWTRALDERDIPYAHIASTKEAGQDPQMMANGVFVTVDDPLHGPFQTVNSPMSLNGAEKVNPELAPGLGEHTQAVLSSLGYSDDDIAGMLASGAAVQMKDD
jgi:formyl-CoA transferase